MRATQRVDLVGADRPLLQRLHHPHAQLPAVEGDAAAVALTTRGRLSSALS